MSHGLHVRRRAHQGRRRTRPARSSSTRSRRARLTGPGLVPFRYSAESHAGFTGVAGRQDRGGVFEPEGEPVITDDGRRRHHRLHRGAARRARQRRARRLRLTPDRPRWQWSSRSTPSRSPTAAGPSSRRASPSAPPRSTGMPGFRGFELLRPVAGESRYFVVTHWDSDEDFQNWVKSAAFTRGHAQARADSQGHGRPRVRRAGVRGRRPQPLARRPLRRARGAGAGAASGSPNVATKATSCIGSSTRSPAPRSIASSPRRAITHSATAIRQQTIHVDADEGQDEHGPVVGSCPPQLERNRTIV